MDIPSWITSVPSKVGEASHGKLSANQWRVLCLVYLPAALVPLWTQKGGQHLELLDNFMELITAIKLASLCDTNESSISLYHKHLAKYLHSLPKLFPDVALVPNHHQALHLSKFLKDFGPAHSQSAWPFESVIGNIQDTPSNWHLGMY